MTKTKEALKTLIKGESEAVANYEQFVVIAETEGYKNIALLLQALLKAEKIHIRNHLQALGEQFTPQITKEPVSSSTLTNIEVAIKGEMEENKKLYPQLMRSIKSEKKQTYGKVAHLSMSWAQKVEKNHANLLKIALKQLKKEQDLEVNGIYVCDVCGNVVFADDNQKECTVCGHDTIFFKRVSKRVSARDSGKVNAKVEEKVQNVEGEK